MDTQKIKLYFNKKFLNSGPIGSKILKSGENKTNNSFKTKNFKVFVRGGRPKYLVKESNNPFPIHCPYKYGKRIEYRSKEWEQQVDHWYGYLNNLMIQYRKKNLVIKKKKKSFKKERPFKPIKPIEEDVHDIGGVGVQIKHEHKFLMPYITERSREAPRIFLQRKKQKRILTTPRYDWDITDDYLYYYDKDGKLQKEYLDLFSSAQKQSHIILDGQFKRKLKGICKRNVSVNVLKPRPFVTEMFNMRHVHDLETDVKAQLAVSTAVLSAINRNVHTAIPNLTTSIGELRALVTESKAQFGSSVEQIEGTAKNLIETASTTTTTCVTENLERYLQTMNQTCDRVELTTERIITELRDLIKDGSDTFSSCVGKVIANLISFLITMNQVYKCIVRDQIGDAIQLLIAYFAPLCIFTSDLIAGIACKFAQYLQTCCRQWFGSMAVEAEEEEVEETFLGCLIDIVKNIFSVDLTNVSRNRVFVQKFINLSQLLKSTTNILEFFLKLLQSILKYILSFFFPSHQVDSLQTASEEWGEFVTTITNKGGIIDTMRDPRLLTPMVDLKSRGEVLLRDANHLSKNSVPGALQISRYITTKLAELNRMHAEAIKLSYNVKARPQPPFCVISGPPGQGKSYILSYLMINLARKCKLNNFIYPSDGGDIIASNGYTYTANSKFFDGYRNQPFFLIDDFLPYNDANVAIDFLDSVMRVVNCMAYHPPMAELELKKTTQINSLFVISTANRKVLIPDTGYSFPWSLMNCPQAFRRRIQLRVEMQVKPEWRTPAGILDIDKVIKANKSTDMGIYEFMRYDESGNLGSLTFNEIVDILYDYWCISMRSYYTSLKGGITLEASLGPVEDDYSEEERLAREIMGDSFDERHLTYNKNSKAFTATSEFQFGPYEIFTGEPGVVYALKNLAKQFVKFYKDKTQIKSQGDELSFVDYGETSSGYQRFGIDYGALRTVEHLKHPTIELYGVHINIKEVFETALALGTPGNLEQAAEILYDIIYDILKEQQPNPDMNYIMSQFYQVCPSTVALFIQAKNIKPAVDITQPGLYMQSKSDYYKRLEVINTVSMVVMSLIAVVGSYMAYKTAKTIAGWYYTSKTVDRNRRDAILTSVVGIGANQNIEEDDMIKIESALNDLDAGCKKCHNKAIEHMVFCDACGILNYECIKCLCHLSRNAFSDQCDLKVVELNECLKQCEALKSYVDKTKVVNKRAKIINRSPKTTVYTAEAISDKQADDLSSKLVHNIGKIVFVSQRNGIVNRMGCQALFVGATDFLTVGHIMRDWNEIRDTNSSFENCYCELTVSFRGTYHFKPKEIVWVYDASTDVVLGRILSRDFAPLPSVKKKFMSANRINQITPSKVLLTYVSNESKIFNGNEFIVPITTKQIGEVTSSATGWFYSTGNHLDLDNNVVDANFSFDYRMSTSAGYCGSPVIIIDKAEQRKIIGIHIAGDKHETGRGAIIDFEYLESLEKLLNDRHGLPIKDEAFSDMDYPMITEGRKEKRWDPFNLEIQLPVLGQVPSNMALTQPSKSNIRTSMLFGLWETNKEVPNLSPRSGCNHLQNGILKEFSKQTKIDMEDWAWTMSVSQVNRNILSLSSPFRGVIPLHIAINGDPSHVEYKSIEMTTSAGWPYSIIARNSQFKGKNGFFEGEEGNKKFIQSIEKEYSIVLDQVRRGEIPFLPFSTTLKDEKKSKDKDIRTFKAGNLILNILGKQYFGAIIAHLQRNCIKGESSIGLNIFSDDWDEFVKFKSQSRPYIVAGDFKNFDRSLNYKLLMYAFEIVDNWYQNFESNAEYEENTIIRRVLWITTIRAYAIVMDSIYLTYWGNSSGNWGTGLINNLCQMIIFRLLWLAVTSRGLDEFSMYVRCGFFGDDHILFVNKEVTEGVNAFNQINIANCLQKWGFKYTDSHKQEILQPYETLQSATYLRAGFKLFPDGKYYARKELQSLKDMMLFVSDYTSLLEATLGNVDDACRQMCVGYTLEEYEELMGEVQKYFIKVHCYNWDIPDYYRYRHLYYTSHDEILQNIDLKPLVQRQLNTTRVGGIYNLVTQGIGCEETNSASLTCNLVSQSARSIIEGFQQISENQDKKNATYFKEQTDKIVQSIVQGFSSSNATTYTFKNHIDRQIGILTKQFENNNAILQDLLVVEKQNKILLENNNNLLTSLTEMQRSINYTIYEALGPTGSLTKSGTLITELEKIVGWLQLAYSDSGVVRTQFQRVENLGSNLAQILSTQQSTLSRFVSEFKQPRNIATTTITPLASSSVEENLDIIRFYLTSPNSDLNKNIDRIYYLMKDHYEWSKQTPTAINAHIYGKQGTVWRPIEVEIDRGDACLKTVVINPVMSQIYGMSDDRSWKAVPIDYDVKKQKSFLRTVVYGAVENQEKELIMQPIVVNFQGFLQTVMYGLDEQNIPVSIKTQLGALYNIPSKDTEEGIFPLAVVSTVQNGNRIDLPLCVNLSVNQKSHSLVPILSSIMEYFETLVRFKRGAALLNVMLSTTDGVDYGRLLGETQIRRRLRPTAPSPSKMYPFITEMMTTTSMTDPLMDAIQDQDEQLLSSIQVAEQVTSSLPTISKVFSVPPIPAIGITDFTATPAMYLSFGVDGSEMVGSHIMSIKPLELVMQNMPVREKLNRFTLLNYSNIKIRFLVQATAFHYGYLCAFWAPPNTTRVRDLITGSAQPLWTLIPMKGNTDVVVEIPWFWPEDWMRIIDFSSGKNKTREASNDNLYDSVSKGLLKPTIDCAGGAPHYLYPTAGFLHVYVYQTLNVMNFSSTPISPVQIGVMVNIEGLQVTGNTKYSSLEMVKGEINDYVIRNSSSLTISGLKFACSLYAKAGNINEKNTTWQGDKLALRTEMLAAANIASNVLTGKSLTQNAVEAAEKCISHVVTTAKEGIVPVVEGATTVEGLASLLGFEKPASVEASTHVLSKWANIANTCGISTAHYLGMSPDNKLGRPASLEAYRFDGSIESIVSRKTLLYTTSIKDEVTNTNLFAWHVHPANVPMSPGYSGEYPFTSVRIGDIVRKFNTYLSYVCEFFEYWRGDIVLTIHTNATPMQTGRLKWYWCPVEVWGGDELYNRHIGATNSANDTLLSSYAMNGYIDLKGEKWTEITIPYCREVPMLQIDYAESVGRRNNGIFYIDLVEKQVSAESSNPPYWLYIYVHGKNMQFFSPRVTHMSSMPWSSQIYLYDGQDDSVPIVDAAATSRGSRYQVAPREYSWQYGKVNDLETIGNYPGPYDLPFVTQSELIAPEHLFGESFMNLMDLCKRPSEAFIANCSTGKGYMFSYFGQAKLYLNQPPDNWSYLYYSGLIRDIDRLQYQGPYYYSQNSMHFGSYQQHTSRLFTAQRGSVIYRVMKDAALGHRVINPHSDLHSFTMSLTPVRQLPIVRVDGGSLPSGGNDAVPAPSNDKYNGWLAGRTTTQGANPVAYWQIQRRLARGLYYKPDNAISQPIEGVVPYYSTQNFWFVPEIVHFGNVSYPKSSNGAPGIVGSRMLQCDEAYPGIHIVANADSSVMVTNEFADDFSLYLMKLPIPGAYWVPWTNQPPLQLEHMPTYEAGRPETTGIGQSSRGPNLPVLYTDVIPLSGETEVAAKIKLIEQGVLLPSGRKPPTEAPPTLSGAKKPNATGAVLVPRRHRYN